MKAALDVLTRLRRHGIAVWSVGKHLRFWPIDAVTGAQVEELRRNKHDLLALLAAGDEGVVWRLARLRSRYPHVGRGSPPSFLLVATGRHPAATCKSCGTTLNDEEAVRCLPCRHAVRLFLEERGC